MSYEYFDLIIESIYYENIYESMKIVEEMHNKFPKEEDCLTSIILDSLLEEIDTSKKKSVKLLIEYLKYLKDST